MSQAAVRFLDTHVMKAVMKAIILYDGVWAKEGPQVGNVRRLTLGLQFNEDSDADAKIIIDFPDNRRFESIVFSVVKEQEKPREDFVQLALSNDVILDKIFSHGTFQDLKSYRLVNKKWDEVASRMLSSKRVVISNAKISNALNLIGILGGPRRRTDRQIISGVFEELTSLIKGSRRFIGNSIEIETVLWPLPNASIKKFLKLHGKAIKYVKLDYRCNARSLQTLYKLLTENLCNVREICVKDFYFQPKTNQVFQTIAEFSAGASRLQNLVKITFASSPHYFTHADGCQAFFGGVIKEASNLNSIVNLPCKLISAVVEAHKIHTVVNLYFGCYLSGEVQSCLENFIATDIPLASVPLLSVPESSRDAWARLLEAKKHTVTSLRVHPAANPIEIPNFPQLQHLYLNLGYNRIFPPGSKLSRNFPNLTTVHVLRFYGADIKSCFPEDDFENRTVDISTSAVVMDIMDSRSLSTGIPQLMMKFPNISTARIDCGHLHEMYNNPDSVSSMWSYFRNVENFQLYNVTYQEFAPYVLDSIITGFPRGICRNLLKRYSNSSSGFDPSLFITAPCIHHLQNLKNFSIEFKGKHGRHAPLAPFITEVSMWCVFELVPNVQFDFYYDASMPQSEELYELLSPFSPVVSIKNRVGPSTED